MEAAVRAFGLAVSLRQRAVVRELGGGSFSHVGPLLRALEADGAQTSGEALPEPLAGAVTEAVETLWRSLGEEADRVVGEARQRFDRELKAALASKAEAEETVSRTRETLESARQRVGELENALKLEQDSVEAGRVALEQERLALARVETQRDEISAQSAERLALRDSAIVERDQALKQVESVRTELQQAAQVREAEDLAATERAEALKVSLAEAKTVTRERDAAMTGVQREVQNLTLINTGLSERAETLLESLASSEGQGHALGAHLEAARKELGTLKQNLTTRLTDKDQVIAALEREVALWQKRADAAQLRIDEASESTDPIRGSAE